MGQYDGRSVCWYSMSDAMSTVSLGTGDSKHRSCQNDAFSESVARGVHPRMLPDQQQKKARCRKATVAICREHREPPEGPHSGCCHRRRIFHTSLLLPPLSARSVAPDRHRIGRAVAAGGLPPRPTNRTVGPGARGSGSVRLDRCCPYRRNATTTGRGVLARLRAPTLAALPSSAAGLSVVAAPSRCPAAAGTT